MMANRVDEGRPVAKPREEPDQGRILALLWRQADEPSARAGLTVGRITAAAREIADEDGLGAVSMRRIAERLGVGTMSLYTYVPGRDELVPLMVDAITAELPPIEPDDGPWRARLESVARGWWDLYRRHPWLLDAPLRRPVLGPHGYERHVRELACLDGIGLDRQEDGAEVDLVRSHVAGTARRAVEVSRDAERSGMTDDEWWATVAPLLERYLVGRVHPVADRLGAAIAAPLSDPRHDLDFGLGRILDGIEALVVVRAEGGSRAG